MFRHFFAFFAFLFFSFSTPAIFAQNVQKNAIPSPESILGFEPADDRKVADWKQIRDYFAKLDSASDRVRVETLGETTLKRPFIAAFVSSAENIKNLDKYKAIQQKLADPRTVKNEQEREQLIINGKTVVAISCSIHSNEIVASQMSMQLAFELASKTDAATKEILDNTILILIPSANPDGVDIVADWYRKTLDTPFEGKTLPPELYHYYAGHDNNRDWFMLNLAETRLVTNLFWKQWFPQIVYDVHQMGQTGARFIIPPFFDPPNPNIPPAILREVGTVGYKMAADLQNAGISGIATNAYFDTWWHGGFRSAPYYHNSIGILSEAASANLLTPVTITEEQLKKERKQRGLDSPLEAATNYPDPWRGGVWKAANIAEIEMVASRAVLSLAAKFRENYLRNFYELNRAAAQTDAKPNQPVAYIIPAGQPNEEAVARMIEILLAQGVEIQQMQTELHLGMNAQEPHEMPLGSFLVLTAQPQRNNVQALFERQVYPHRLNANGEAEVPYDVAGWTLPLQMGVETHAVTRIVEAADKRNLKQISNVNEARKTLGLKEAEPFAKLSNPLAKNVRVGVYKSYTASMDEGWTRFVFDQFQIPFTSVFDKDVRAGDLRALFDAIVLPSQSENSILNGYKKGEYPEEFTGGVTEAGAENLKKFVEDGGTLVCFDDSCEMAIKRFNLPLKNSLEGLKRSEFYSPGSIMQLEVDTAHPLAKNFKKQTAAYFINSSAFEITNETEAARVKIVARYAPQNPLLSGWLLGEKYLAGKIALAEIEEGKGKIVLFAFRPQHRGQTWATFPFIFNSLER